MALPFYLPHPHLLSLSPSTFSSSSFHQSLHNPGVLKAATALSYPRNSFLPQSSFLQGVWRWQRLRINSNVVNASNLSTPGGRSNQHYQFRDEGSDLDLRLQLREGDGAEPLSAKDILVDAQESSLAVAARTPEGVVRTLLARSRLYGRIKPSETVWFIDENEVVFSLKKADKELIWPGLLENWETLCLGVPKLLKGIPVYIVGYNTNINWAVAQELATALGYAPIKTKQLLEELTKCSLIELEAIEGEEGVTHAEDAILATLNTHVRVAVATLGGKQGVASKATKWKNLYGGISIWLTRSNAQDDASAQEEARRAKQEGVTAYSKADAIVTLGGWENDSAQSAAEGCLTALKCLLDADRDLPGKKNLYIRLGCRGDWPDIMPPGWNPDSEKTEQDLPVQAGAL